MEEGRRRNKWSAQEDEVILAHVNVHGAKDWGKLAETLQATLGGGRTAKSCRLRWYNELTPTINRAPFSDEEMAFIAAAVLDYGTAWSRISTAMAAAGHTGRTDNAIKNCYHVRLKRSMQEQGIEPGVKQTHVPAAPVRITSTSATPGRNTSTGKQGPHSSPIIGTDGAHQTNSAVGPPGNVFACVDFSRKSADTDDTQDWNLCHVSHNTTDDLASHQNGSRSSSPKRGLEQRTRIVKRPSRLQPTSSQPFPHWADSGSEDADVCVAKPQSWAAYDVTPTEASAFAVQDKPPSLGMPKDRQFVHARRLSQSAIRRVLRGKSVPNLMEVNDGNQSWLLKSAPDEINAEFLAKLDQELLSLDPSAFQAPALGQESVPQAVTAAALEQAQRISVLWSSFDVSSSLQAPNGHVSPVQMIKTSFVVGTVAETSGNESRRRILTHSQSQGARRSPRAMCSVEKSSTSNDSRVRFADMPAHTTMQISDEAACSVQQAPSIDSHPEKKMFATSEYHAGVWPSPASLSTPISPRNTLSCDPSINSVPVLKVFSSIPEATQHTTGSGMLKTFTLPTLQPTAPPSCFESGTSPNTHLEWPEVNNTLSVPQRVPQTLNTQFGVCMDVKNEAPVYQHPVDAEMLLMFLSDSLAGGNSTCPAHPQLTTLSIHDAVDVQDSNDDFDAELIELQSLLGNCLD